MSAKVTIQIDYFKPSGKWYSGGETRMVLEEEPTLDQIRLRVVEMRTRGRRPGLSDNTDCGFYWIVRTFVNGDELTPIMFHPMRLK